MFNGNGYGGLIVGSIAEDIHLNMKFREFYERYGVRLGLNEDDKHCSKIDTKHESEFFEVMEELIEMGLIVNSAFGGGGENSRQSILRLCGEKWLYSDTAKKPKSYNAEGSFFAGLVNHVTAFVTEKDNGESVSVKTKRRDLDMELPQDFENKLIDYIKGYCVFVNSISNEQLARTIAKHARKGCYFLATEYLKPGKGSAFEELVKRSDIVFFSGKEFYWLNGTETQWGRQKARD